MKQELEALLLQLKNTVRLIEEIRHDQEQVLTNLRAMIDEVDGNHDCKLDDFGTGHCDNPIHGEKEN